MRRIRHLDQCDYIVPIGQKTSQLLTLSNRSNVLLERTWSQDLKPPLYLIQAHAKFDSAQMQGMQILVNLTRNGIVCSSAIDSVKLFLVDPSSFADTLLGTLILTQSSPGYWEVDLSQAQLNPVELSAAEVFSLEVTLKRKRQKYFKKFWFNHLGCFDQILRLRQAMEYQDLVKLDE